MKKYFLITLLVTVLLTSCGNNTKVTENSTGTVVLTGEVTAIWTGEVATWEVEGSSGVVVEESALPENITEKDGVYTYVNSEKSFEISYKKSDDLVSQEGLNWTVFAVAASDWASVTVISEDYSSATEIKDLKEYFDLSITNVESVLKVSDLKKEETTLNGQKAYKASYVLDLSGTKAVIEQYILSTDAKVAYVVTKTYIEWKGSSKVDGITETFKLLK